MTNPNSPNSPEGEVKAVPSSEVGKVVQSFVNQKKVPKKKVVCQKQADGSWVVSAT